MKIAVTGSSSGLGKFLVENLEGAYGVSVRDNLPEGIRKIDPADILINLAYDKSTLQSDLLLGMFKLWETKPKTIINIGSSGIYESQSFDPSYIANKRHLTYISQNLQMTKPYKTLRIVNLNPSTLENNKIFGSNVNKLLFKDVLDILEFIIKLPQHIEVSDITLRRTQSQVQQLL